MSKLLKPRVKVVRKAGRPRKPGERWPSGDRKPSETEREAKSVVIEARMRQHSLTAEEAKTDLAGYVLGRMRIDGSITEPEHKAGVAFAMDLCRWYGDMSTPLPIAKAINYEKVGGQSHTGEESETAQERAIKARNNLVRMRTLLGGIANPGYRQLMRVLIDDDASARYMRAGELAWFRGSLDVLVGHYGFGSRIVDTNS